MSADRPDPTLKAALSEEDRERLHDLIRRGVKAVVEGDSPNAISTLVIVNVDQALHAAEQSDGGLSEAVEVERDRCEAIAVEYRRGFWDPESRAAARGHQLAYESVATRLDFILSESRKAEGE